ncbi:MAG: hypothetical protein AAB368_06430 [bacterium]
MTGPLRPPRDWVALAALAVWMAFWGTRGEPSASVVLLHWPITAILVFGFTRDLRGGLIASAASTLLALALLARGALPSWSMAGWQLLLYGIFGLYPFKFMQIRSERRHHYRTLIEYKHAELGTLKEKLAEVDGRCREIEARLRRGSDE